MLRDGIPFEKVVSLYVHPAAAKLCIENSIIIDPFRFVANPSDAATEYCLAPLLRPHAAKE